MRRRHQPTLESGWGLVQEGSAGPGVVVVGVDGTLTATRAASYATGVAARNGALLVVVHARPAPIPAWAGFGLWCPVEAENDVEACGVLRDAVSRAERVCGHVESDLRVGDPAYQLCNVAEARRADVIVVGSSRSVRHRIGWSVPSRLAKCGHWPVVVVP
jgi:nucleotide-binding universal stress UspA family protein